MTGLVPYVLVVDGDQTFARTLCRLLTENGYNAAMLSTASALTEYLLTQPVDLLLLDLSLPEPDGLSVLDAIRRDHGSRNLPVIALCPPDSRAAKSGAPGASEVIVKPVQVRDLLARIRVHLRTGRTLNRSRAEARSQAALVELLRDITADRPPRELFQVLVRQVATALRIPRCSILFGKPGAERVTVAAASENPMLSDLTVDVSRYPEIKKALETGQVVMVQDAPTDPLYQGLTTLETRSTLVLPFSLGGERAGVFFLRTGEGDPPLGDTDLRFAAKVVDSAVSAIERALAAEESARSSDALRQVAETDPLTGLLNREALGRRIAEEVARARRGGTSLSCLRLHLGDLKRLPGTHGDRTGDRVLAQFAELLRREQRSVDVVARHGDEEFIMLMPDTGGAGARLFAERILNQAGRTGFGEAGSPVVVPVNLGLATYPGESVTDGSTLLETAARNLQRARSDGRNTYRD